MAPATAHPEQKPFQQGKRPAQAKAARVYQKAKLSEATEDEMLATYAPVISQMVHRFVPLVRVTVDVDDLKNIASLSLIQAAHGFDPTAGMSFESYARMRIRGAILDEIRKSQPLSRTVYSRIEKEAKTLRGRIRRAYQLTTGHPPTPVEMATLEKYAQKHGLPNLCRVLFNLSEFTYVD